MIGQNLQSKHAELRAEEDFSINKKAEIEIETILMHLENQNDLIVQILKRLEEAENKASKSWFFWLPVTKFHWKNAFVISKMQIYKELKMNQNFMPTLH